MTNKAKVVVHTETELRRELAELQQDLARFDDLERKYISREVLTDRIDAVKYLLND